MPQSVVNFFSDKKSYIVAGATLLYAAGIHFHWWPHDPQIDLALGGAYGITIRAALKKIYLLLLANKQAAPSAAAAPAPAATAGPFAGDISDLK